MSKKTPEKPVGQIAMTAILGYSFNKDKSKVAVCDGSPDLKIFKVTGEDARSWTLDQSLVSHDMKVLGVDWGHKTNRIVSCSEDRTSYIWCLKDSGKWEPELVVLGHTHCTYGALCVSWCEGENKFAVGTGCSQTHICNYDEDNKWWITKGAKGHKSSVTTVAWMPGSDDLIFASGSTDCYVKIFSGYLRNVDGKVANPGKVGTELHSLKTGGWVHALAFSPEGSWLAAVSHDSSITFLDTSGSEYDDPQVLRLRLLPFTTVCFVSETECVAAGHEFSPQCFSLEGKEWKHVGQWTEQKKEVEKKTTLGSKAMAMFQEQAKFGTGNVKKVSKSKHRAAISSIQPWKNGEDFTFTTSGLDGCIHYFKSKDMQPVS